MKRHITEALKILYKRFCLPEEMDEKRMKAMRDICYSYEVSTKVPHMRCVLVIEKDGAVRQRIPYDEETGAIIQLYDKESRIVWESMDGRYYTDSIAYETKRLFYEPRFMEMCKKYEDEAGMWKKTGEVVEVTFDTLRESGLTGADEEKVLRLCSEKSARKIREKMHFSFI